MTRKNLPSLPFAKIQDLCWDPLPLTSLGEHSTKGDPQNYAIACNLTAPFLIEVWFVWFNDPIRQFLHSFFHEECI